MTAPWPLWATIAVSSLAGSLHCVAMCGPLVGLHGGARSLRLALVHALGRLTTYAALGAAAGLVGGAVDLAGHLAAVQQVAALIAGATIVAWGVRAIAVARGWLRVRSGGGALFRRGLSQLGGRRAIRRAWLVGVLTGLLPCGWLWAFVVTAAGTGHAATGALVMAVFWAGTLPMLVGAALVLGPLLGVLRARVPVITAVVLLALGAAALVVRAPLLAPSDGVPACHRLHGAEGVR